MKPRLRRTPGVPGLSPQTWWCTGGGAVGYGETPTAAYSLWSQSQMQMQSMNPVWLRESPPKPLSIFDRWAKSSEEWWR